MHFAQNSRRYRPYTTLLCRKYGLSEVRRAAIGRYGTYLDGGGLWVASRSTGIDISRCHVGLDVFGDHAP